MVAIPKSSLAVTKNSKICTNMRKYAQRISPWERPSSPVAFLTKREGQLFFFKFPEKANFRGQLCQLTARSNRLGAKRPGGMVETQGIRRDCAYFCACFSAYFAHMSAHICAYFAHILTSLPAHISPCLSVGALDARG
jgi:hypothetical protein